LGAGQRQTNAIATRQHGAAWQLIEQCHQLRLIQPFDTGLLGGGRRLPVRHEGDGACALAANGVEQGEVVLTGHLALLSNEPTQIALWQQTSKEGPALVVVEGIGTEWQRLRKRDCVGLRKPVVVVLKTQPPPHQRQGTDRLIKKPDGYVMRHGHPHPSEKAQHPSP
jgi:hypothetical protein